MLEGLYSIAAGLAAQQVQLDAIGNDMANVNTDGYKSERVAFNDLLYNDVDVAGTETTVGSGSGALVIGRSEAQGSLSETGNPLDLAIEGRGYFEVTAPGGQQALTRSGSFTLNAQGEIVTATGARLSPPISVPKGVDAQQLRIAQDGTVSANGRTLGQIKLVEVPAPDALTSLGGDLLATSAQSGAPLATTSAHIHQGALEQSDVDLGSEMTDLVTTERAFQMDSSALQNESQMMSIANELRPSS